MDESEHFLFPARLNRIQYLVRIIFLDVCVWLLFAAWPSADLFALWSRLLLVCFGEFALAIYGVFFVLLPRVTDAGLGRWWILIGLFPAIGTLFQLILVFVPTQRTYDTERA